MVSQVEAYTMTECVLKSYFRAFIRLKWCQKVLEVEPGQQFASHETENTEAMLCLDPTIQVD